VRVRPCPLACYYLPYLLRPYPFVAPPPLIIMTLKPPPPRPCLLGCLVLVGLGAGHSGCATAAKNFAEGWKRGPAYSAARAHRGTAFKPTFGADGSYTGYTQKVGKYTFQHLPGGTIIGVVEELPPLKWEEHYDAQARLVKKTLARYVHKEGVPRGTTEPVTTIHYHYSAQGELLGQTTLIHKEEGYDLAVHNDARGHALPPYAPLPWTTQQK